MKLCTLISSLFVFVYVVSADDLADLEKHIANLDRDPVFDRNDAKLNKERKTIESTYAGFGNKKPFKDPQQADMEVEREQVNLNLKDERKDLVAGARESFGSANYNGEQYGSATIFGQSGGFANAGPHRGLMKNENEDEEKVANFVADGKHTLDTVAEGRDGDIADKMWANSSSGQMNFGVNPDDMDKTGGDGTLLYNNNNPYKGGKYKADEIYVYDVEQRTNNDATAQLTADSQGKASQASDGFLSQLTGNKKAKSWTCSGQKIGESICRDENGNTVGKVVATDDGRVTTFNKQGVPIAKGKATQISKTQYRVEVNDGLATARTDKIKEYDCTMEVAGHKASEKIKVKKPLLFEYASQKSSDGSVTFQWPDCFMIGGEVMLAKDVDPKRLAAEYIVNVLPIGRLRCMDSGTCGRECYYCDYCDSKKKYDLAANNDYQQLCDTQGNGRYQTLKTTICPPPEDSDFAICSKFSKSLSETEYWNKQGDIDVQMRMWLRPKAIEQVEKEFFDKLSAPLIGGANRLAMQAEWAIDNGLQTGTIKPTDAQLKEWYVKKKSGKEELLLCRRSIIKYNVGGEKVDSSFLIETTADAKKVPSIFQGKPCKEITELEDLEYQADKQAYQEANSGGGSSILSSIFGRNNGRRL
jgi:hypothetical protein